MTRLNDMSLILTKAKRAGFFEDVKPEEVDFLASQARILFGNEEPPEVTSTAKTLPTWARKRTLTQLNQSPTKILCIGDSTTAGVYSDSYTTAIGTTNQGGLNSYPSQLAKRLTSFGVPSEYSFCLPGHAGNEDSRFALTGSFGYAGYGAGMSSAVTAASAGTLTVTPGIAANRYVIYYFGDPGTGAFSATATGGTAVAVSTAQVAGNVYKSAEISASAVSAGNTLTITQTSGTIFILGIEYWDSTKSNLVRIFNAGSGGSTTNMWSNTSAPGSLNFIKAIAPDLTIISLGINDEGAGVSAFSAVSAIGTIATAAKISGDVLLMSAFPHGNTSNLDTYNASYQALNYPYVDIQKRWGYLGQTLQFLTVDNTHPNAIGYGDIATAIAKDLMSF